MKAYIYRSGHVMIGPSVPEGAIELSDWDNEAELLTVVRWFTRHVDDDEGAPCMAIPEIVDDIRNSLFLAAEERITIIRRQIQRGLIRLRRNQDELFYCVGPIKKWSPGECLAMAVPQ